MTKVIKQKDKYLVFETFVRDLDIIAQVEPTAYIHLATEFMDVHDAAEYVRIARDSGYDTSDYVVVDKDEIAKQEKQAEEDKKDAKLKALWNSSNEEAKRALLSGIKEDKRQEFLEKVGDTSGITAFTNEEIAERRIQRLEKTLGIEFTEEQKQILRTKEDF